MDNHLDYIHEIKWSFGTWIHWHPNIQIFPIFLLIPEKLRCSLVLRRQKSPGAENVFQELYGQVLQVMVAVEILKMLYVEN